MDSVSALLSFFADRHIEADLTVNQRFHPFQVDAPGKVENFTDRQTGPVAAGLGQHVVVIDHDAVTANGLDMGVGTGDFHSRGGRAAFHLGQNVKGKIGIQTADGADPAF